MSERLSPDPFFKDQMNQAANSFKKMFSISSAMTAVVNQLQKMPEEVYKIDTAMTNLCRVTNETDAAYQKFLSSAGDNARELGRSISSIVDQTARWAKLGYNLNDASKLAETSSIYSNISKADDETAVNHIAMAMKNFNITAMDSIRVVDSLNRLGSEFSASSAELGDGLSISASALSGAGNDINETLAMLAGLSEITQDSREAGNALKVLSLRIRGYDEGTGTYSNNIKELSREIASLTKTESTPGGISLFTDRTEQTYKSTYALLKDISEIYDELNGKSQAELVETLGGSQRGESVAELLRAFQSGQVGKAYDISFNSSGSAYEAQVRWLDSLQGKLQQLEATFQSLSNTVLDSDLLKGIVDFGTGTINILDTIIDQIGVLIPLLGGAGIAAFVKNFD